MNVQVINIEPHLEPILMFLYPNYSLLEDTPGTSNFIIKKDICSKPERENLEVRYSNCIFISKRIFDEVWTEEVIHQKMVEFARIKFKSRKRTLPYTKDNFVESIINSVFSNSTEEIESSIMELFNDFGSINFVKTFISLSQTTPYKIIVSSMNTFIAKLLQEDQTSIFYKKKQILYKDKVKRNLLSAYDNLMLEGPNATEFSYIKFYMDLTK